jgi:hypothetical protein
MLERKFPLLSPSSQRFPAAFSDGFDNPGIGTARNLFPCLRAVPPL